MRDNDIVILSVIIVFLVIIFGGNLGLTVSGQAPAIQVNQDTPTILGMFSWAWNGIGFFFGLIAFTVPGIPYWLSAFFIGMGIMLGFILLKWVRGGSQVG